MAGRIVTWKIIETRYWTDFSESPRFKNTMPVRRPIATWLKSWVKPIMFGYLDIFNRFGQVVILP